jgi:hypothetical protein
MQAALPAGTPPIAILLMMIPRTAELWRLSARSPLRTFPLAPRLRSPGQSILSKFCGARSVA